MNTEDLGVVSIDLPDFGDAHRPLRDPGTADD
jgi:hypothetical protein